MSWVELKRSFPLEHTPILVLNNKDKIMGISMFDGYEWYQIEEDFGEITHWLPIPELPKEKRKYTKRMRKKDEN